MYARLVLQVNRMCSSLTDQVRSIAKVTTAVARGDLTQKIDIEVEGEMLTLKRTVNSMVDQLSAFASEVTRVALEVGTQGILGGQARVEGVQGTWADLTRNVNVRHRSAPHIHTSLHIIIVDSDPSRWADISAENGREFDGPGAVYLGGHEGRREWRLEPDGQRRRAG